MYKYSKTVKQSEVILKEVQQKEIENKLELAIVP